MEEMTKRPMIVASKGEQQGEQSLTDTSVSAQSRPITRDEKGRFVKGCPRPLRRSPWSRPGNLSAVKKPWLTYWRRRALPVGDRWVLQLVQDYVPALVAEKGGEGEVTYAERKVAEIAATSRVCWSLAMAKGDLAAVARFINAERQALSDLGLQRRARSVNPWALLDGHLSAAPAQEGAGQARPIEVEAQPVDEAQGTPEGQPDAVDQEGEE